MLGIMRRKSVWQRAIAPFTHRRSSRSHLRSGLGALGGAIGVTATSAIISGLRRREDG